MQVVRGVLVGLTLLAIVTLGKAGGTTKPKDLIIGKWKAAEKKGEVEIMATVEFAKDGGLKMKIGELAIDGKYKFIDDNNFEITLEFGGKKAIEKVKIESITKDKMVTTDKNGKTEFTRINK